MDEKDIQRRINDSVLHDHVRLAFRSGIIRGLEHALEMIENEYGACSLSMDVRDSIDRMKESAT